MLTSHDERGHSVRSQRSYHHYLGYVDQCLPWSEYAVWQPSIDEENLETDDATYDNLSEIQEF